MLLPLLLAGHFLGDWVVQTEWQALNKMSSWKANFQHMLGYHLTLAVAIGFVSPLWVTGVVLAVSLPTHAFIDRRWPVRWLMCKTNSAPFSETMFGVVAVDQALHLNGEQRCRQARLRNLSLTDCISFECMKRLNVTEAIAMDAHFQREQISLP